MDQTSEKDTGKFVTDAIACVVQWPRQRGFDSGPVMKDAWIQASTQTATKAQIDSNYFLQEAAVSFQSVTK